jgi:deoxyribodipyrimidine photolyase-related protein
MTNIIILPNQLFEDNIIIKNNPDATIYLVEHPIFFTNYAFHKMKLVLHRSTMKYYFDYLEKKYKNTIKYIEYDEYEKIKKLDNLIVYNPIEHEIMKEYQKKKNITIIENPNFICNMETLEEYIKEKNILKHNSFYIWCRNKFSILLDKNKKPLGGKWSFDTENRNPFPADFKEKIKFPKNSNKYIQEAIKYVEKKFPNNIGESKLYINIEFNKIKTDFRKFLKTRLNCFGDYQDAQNDKIILGCHSLLSPLINLGMLNPCYIIKEVEKFYNNNKVKLNSVEAYIRQLFWREYTMFIYMFNYDKLIKSNYFKNNKKLDKSWYNSSTQIPCIDHLIDKATKYGYLHHIERLMFVGNFMLLSEIHPDQVYEWFMIMFIDSYNWVMAPNVYGMSQYSSGGLMMSRPYFSSSNYIDKMSNFKKKPNIYNKILINKEELEWYEIWDALYYNFINKHKLIFKKNYSTASHVMHLNRMTESKRKKILDIAKKYLDIY